MRALDAQSLPDFQKRLQTLTADDRPAWGTITPTGLMRHLIKAFRASLGDVTITDQSSWLSRTITRWIVLYMPIRWPKGIKAPKGAVDQPDADEDAATLDDARKELFAIMERFV